MNRIFFYPDNTRYILFTEQALSHMYAHAQKRLWQTEAGGEIFSSEPDSNGLVIRIATGPNPTDCRGRYAWNPDRRASDRNRQVEFVNNRHAVGLWHTHPECFPSPSVRDQETTWEYLTSFYGDRSRYLMVIIGNRGKPPEIAVWVATNQPSREWTQLSEEKTLATNRTSIVQGKNDQLEVSKEMGETQTITSATVVQVP